MSLNDVDKSSFDRGTPKPNHSDQLIDGARSNHGTNSVNYVSDGTNQSLIQGIHSGFFTIVQSGIGNSPSVSVSDPGAGLWVSSGLQTTLAAHNLGYIPAVIAYVLVGGSYILLPYTILDGTGSAASWVTISVQVDNTNVYSSVNVLTQHLSKTFAAQQIKYYLLRERASIT